MDGDLARPLDSEASLHDLGELQGQGIQTVRVLRQSRLALLARLAVNRALQFHLDGLGIPETARRILEGTAEHELKLLLQRGLAGPTAPPPATVEAPEQLAADPGDRRRTPALPGVEPDAALREDGPNTQLDALERRVVDLLRVLDAADRLLRDGPGGTSSGLASAWNRDLRDPVLDRTSPQFETKTKMLNALLEANLKLHEAAKGQTPGYFDPGMMKARVRCKRIAHGMTRRG